jgi:hypothetical protein
VARTLESKLIETRAEVSCGTKSAVEGNVRACALVRYGRTSKGLCTQETCVPASVSWRAPVV